MTTAAVGRDLVVPLDAASELAAVGGKGASLARMARAGLPVPPGFSVTTAAYRDFVSSAALRARILDEVARVDPRRPDTAAAAAEQIRTWFLEHPVPAATPAAITAAYAGLGAEVAVAVRSSATAEDLPGLSVGQQDTFLDIRGPDALLDAVRRCWASLWTARAIVYRLGHDVAAADVALAVVVQELVAAESAGVLFTRDPVTGSDAIVVNASWGLGDAVVGGRVTPDSYVVERTTGGIRDQVVADKAVMTVRGPAGTVDVAVPPPRRRAAVLSRADAGELGRLGVRIEQLYGMPMDVEWARSGAASGSCRAGR